MSDTKAPAEKLGTQDIKRRAEAVVTAAKQVGADVGELPVAYFVIGVAVVVAVTAGVAFAVGSSRCRRF